MTDSRADRWVVTALNFFDEETDHIYFTAARSIETGSDEKTEQRKRHIFREKRTARGSRDPQCVSCTLVLSGLTGLNPAASHQLIITNLLLRK